MKKITLHVIMLFMLTSTAIAQGTYKFQPDLEARAVNLLYENQFRFKDLNKNKKLDIYEDWRQPVN